MVTKKNCILIPNFQKHTPMKKENYSSTIKKILLLILPILTICTAKAETINCSDVDCIKSAMANAQPGDEIIIQPGTYATEGKVQDLDSGIWVFYLASVNGTESNPITLRGASSTNLPVLTGSRDGDILLVSGDHWIIKDLEISGNDRGILTHQANYNQFINLTLANFNTEALHLRANSSNNLVQNCTITNTGLEKPDRGEGVYVGTDVSSHGTYPPFCNNNIIEGCTFGPNITAEAVDIKEQTSGTIVRNCVFTAVGMAGNVNDAFIDLKGSNSFIYENTFNQDGEANLRSGLDLQERTEGDGFRNAIFDNTFNLDDTDVATARKKQGDANLVELHIWNNTRIPASKDYPDVLSNSDNLTNIAIASCPDWNIVSCSTTLSIAEFNPLDNVTLYPNPAQERFYVSGILNNSPVSVAIMTLQGRVVSRSENVLLGTQGIDVTNLAQGMYIVKIKSDVIEGSIMALIK